MVLAAAANIAFFKLITHDFDELAATASVAGKVRMLSQKIDLDMARFAVDPESSQAPVQSGIAEFEAMLDALTHGGTIFGISVQPANARTRSALETLRTEWQHYRAAVEEILDASSAYLLADFHGAELRPPALLIQANVVRDQMLLNSTRLLHASENMVDAIVKDIQQRQRLASLVMYSVFAVIAVCLLWMLWFIHKRLAQPLALLHRGAQQLTDGEYDVHLQYPVDDELGRLIHMFNRSAAHFSSLLHDLEYSHDSLKRAETMFRNVVENSGIGVYVCLGGRFLFVNRELARILGYERETMMAEMGPQDIFIGSDQPDARTATKRLQSSDSRTSAKTSVLRQARCRNGSLVELDVFESAMKLENRTVSLCVVLDVTQRRQDEASARLARLVYDVSSEGMVITDSDGYIVHVNPAFTDITGYTAQEVLGKKMSLLSSGRHDTSFYEAMWLSIRDTGSWVGEIWNRHKNGEEFAERLSINTSYDEDGRVQHRVGLFSDITARKNTDELIWRQAHFDALTDLPNRKMLQDRLNLAMSRAIVAGTNVAVGYLDLDHFKDVNDTLGHHIGDELLKQAAARIEACLRQGDTVGRQGGDEFTIIMAGVDSILIADQVSQRIMDALARPFKVQGDVVCVTASLGLTLFPRDGNDTGQLFKNADMAMYEAKSQGRNQHCWFNAAMEEKVMQRQRLSRELSGAVRLDQFILEYQPIIDLRSGAVCKAEALIRWNHPERGQIGPAEFIPFAEDSGAINGIGDWVFETAVRQADEWRNTYGDGFQVTINVSPVQFLSDASGISKWSDRLDTLKLRGSSLVLEITEGLLMDACGKVTRRLQAFQRDGIQIALDDFGTGYSSLAYLKKFDIDYIKIDPTFVSNLSADTDDRTLCDAIVVMAHRLGLKVIAEGIETAEQYRLLAESGCDYGQGYLLGKAIHPLEFEKMMDHRKQLS